MREKGVSTSESTEEGMREIYIYREGRGWSSDKVGRRKRAVERRRRRRVEERSSCM